MYYNYYSIAESGEPYRDAWVKGNIYRQVRRGSQEKRKDAWAIPKERVAKFQERKISQVRIYDEETNTVYHTTASKYIHALDEQKELTAIYVKKDEFDSHKKGT